MLNQWIPQLDLAILTGLTNMAARSVYLSSPGNEALVGLNSSARANMLAADSSGATTISIPAGKMPVGSILIIIGQGLIGATTAAPGAYNLIPCVTPSGGSKTDMVGFSVAPLLGADGTCTIMLVLAQTASGLRPQGEIRYGVQNGMAYNIVPNSGTIGTQPVTTPSDPNVDRVIGVEGFWANANAANYVRCRQTFGLLITP